MTDKDTNDHPDKALIEHLGGATKVAELLGLTEKGAVQRVHNWTRRGIPPEIRLKHLDLFPLQSPASVEAA